MKRVLSTVALTAIISTPVYSGGWETGRLDNSFLY